MLVFHVFLVFFFFVFSYLDEVESIDLCETAPIAETEIKAIFKHFVFVGSSI